MTDESSAVPCTAERPNPLRRLAEPFIVFVERFYPDPFVFVIVLTLVTLVAAVLCTPTSMAGTLQAWGEGLPSLLAFTTQLSITLVVAHAFSSTAPLRAVLRAAARLPQRNWQAYAMISACAGLASLIAWPLGLIVGATLAKRVAVEGARRGLRLDYPLLVASAYSGFVVWHMGYSGSAPLFVATAGHSLEAQIGVVPVTATIFSVWNMVLAAVTLLCVSLACPLMAPAKERTHQIEPETLARFAEEDAGPVGTLNNDSWGTKLSHWRGGSLVFGLLVAAYLVHWFVDKGFTLDLNVVNWSLLAAGLLLARSPAHYTELVLEGGKSLGSIMLQYPFYAGIMGVMAGSGLAKLMSGWFAQVSSALTLPLWAFVSGGIVNLFIPSGGGQWAVQGPIFIDAAQALQVDPALIVMAVAYGDQWTNMIQPFWTIPLLAIAGLSIRDVMGYTFVTLLLSSVLFLGGLLVASLVFF